MTLTTAGQVERDRVENLEELLHGLDEWQRTLRDSVGDTKSMAGKRWLDLTTNTLERIAELDDDLHVADLGDQRRW